MGMIALTEKRIVGRKCYFSGPSECSTVLLQMVDDHDLSVLTAEIEEIIRLSSHPFQIVAVKVDRWQEELSPWAAPPAFGNQSFGSGAADTLEYLQNILIPELQSKTIDKLLKCCIGGYSLAGLFALWSVYKTDAFFGAAAVSPSVWFPGWEDYIARRNVRTPLMYLSLGKKEENTRNQMMTSVGHGIRAQEEAVRGTCVCTLEWNEGNHFTDPEKRMARGFAWLLNQNALSSIRDSADHPKE